MLKQLIELAKNIAIKTKDDKKLQNQIKDITNY